MLMTHRRRERGPISICLAGQLSRAPPDRMDSRSGARLASAPMALGRVVENGERTSDEGTRAPQAKPERAPAGARGRGLGERHLAPPDPHSGHGLRVRLHAADTALRLARALDTEPDTDALRAVRGLGNRATAAHARPAATGTIRIDPADAPGEHEADRIAAEVVEAGDAPVTAPRPILARATRSAPAAVARAAEPTHGPEGGPVDAAIERRILAAAGTGARLDDAVRRPLERGFGADLGGLRIHTGAEADGLSRSLRARAFTVGPDIFFRSGAFQPHSAGGRRLLAHEVTHALQQGAVSGPVAVQRSLTIQRAYADLDDLGKARVDAQAAVDYDEKAEDFEYQLGLKLSTSPHAEDIAGRLLGKVRTIVDAWATATKQDRLKTYEQEFGFAEGDKYYGSFVMSGEAIQKVFDNVKHQPLRKRLKVVYNAVRNNNLAKWLKVAADNLAEVDRVAQARLAGDNAAVEAPVEVLRKSTPARTAGGLLDLADAAPEHVAPDFAKESGLKDILEHSAQLRADVTQASAREKVDTGAGKVHVAAPDMWSGLARGTADEVAKLDVANRDRLYGKNVGVDLDDQETLTRGDVPDLTAHEIQLLRQRRGKGGAEVGKYRKWRFKNQREKTLLWEQGREAYTVFLNSPFEKAAAEIGARLEAGLSGSAAMMFTAAKNLGLGDPDSLKNLRLAMLGWMLPNHDHSFYEIMTAAEIHQVPFVKNAGPGKQYEAAENFAPEAVDDLKSLLPENEFPAHFLSLTHKDKLAGGVQAEALQDAAKPDGSPHTLAKYRQSIEALGLPNAVAQALDERDCVEVLALSARVQSTELAEEVGDEAAVKKLHARNVFELAHVREESPYRHLAHKYPLRVELWLGELLEHHHKPRLVDHELLAGAAAHLLALDADVAARRQSLVAAGVPLTLLEPLGDHVLHDLVHLHAFLATLHFDNTRRIDEAPNVDAHQKLLRTEVWNRLNRLNPTPGFIAMYRLLRGLYGHTFTHSLFDQAERTPAVQTAIALGVPDAIAAALPAQGHVDLGLLAAEIQTRVGDPDAIAKLNTLGATYANLKAYIDGYHGPNRFDMVVAAIARTKGVDLAGSPRLQTLAHLTSVLSSNPIPDVNPATAGYAANVLAAAKEAATGKLNAEHKGLVDLGYDRLTDVEATAIREYTGSAGDGDWQRAISQTFVPEPAAIATPADLKAITWNEALPRMAPKIKAAVAGLRKLPVYQAPVYSGQRDDLKGRPQDAMRIFAVGTMHPQHNFLSTSKSVDTSYIARNSPGVAWVIEHVRTGRDISYLSQHFEEMEVLFPPGARLLVTRVEDRTLLPDGHGKVWVFMDEV